MPTHDDEKVDPRDERSDAERARADEVKPDFTVTHNLDDDLKASVRDYELSQRAGPTKKEAAGRPDLREQIGKADRPVGGGEEHEE